MKGYSAQEIERLFSRAGRARPKSKASGDAGYWTGGHCNYGASHNLREDCETLAGAFASIESLGNIKDVLKECTSEVEFNSKKRDFVRKCEEAVNGLRPNIGSHSSMFGICIIWGEEAMTPQLEKVIKKNKAEIEKVKSLLEKETYKWVEEIKQLNLEIKQIEARMKENKKKAMNEKDPAKKALLLQMIEEDGELLQKKYSEVQKLENKFNFDPAQKVRDMVEAMRRAIEGKGGGSSGDGDNNGSGGGGGNRKKPKDPNNPFGDGNDKNDDDVDDKKNKNKNKRKKKDDDNQSNQQLIILAMLALVVIFFLMNQKDSPPRSRYDDYY